MGFEMGVLVGCIGAALIGCIVVFFLSRMFEKRCAVQRQAFTDELAEAQSLCEQMQGAVFNVEKQLAIACEKNKERDTLALALEETRKEVQMTREAHVRLEAQSKEALQQAGEKLQLLQQTRDAMTLEFKQLSVQALEKTQKTNDQRLEQLLTPLGKNIERFEKNIRENYDKETRDRTSLRTELKQLHELNKQMSNETENLTRALQGQSKTRGDWGEMILERLLEDAGLHEGREYSKQEQCVSEHGQRLQPDIIIHLPEQKHIVIDSKLSLVSWLAWNDAKDNEQAEAALKSLLVAMRTHVKELSAKNYQNLHGLKTLDFVLMFIPIEAAFALAVGRDHTLFQEAFDKNIVLVSPTTLLATLRTISSIWRYEHQNNNALEIARKAGSLYDKITIFLTDMKDIDQRLNQARVSYDHAMQVLITGRGNILRTAEQVKTLGAKTAKQIPTDMLE